MIFLLKMFWGKIIFIGIKKKLVSLLDRRGFIEVILEYKYKYDNEFLVF